MQSLFLLGGYSIPLYRGGYCRVFTHHNIYSERILLGRCFFYLSFFFLMQSIQIFPATSMLSIDEYAHISAWLLQNAFQIDPTVIPHSVEEMSEKYHSSVIALMDDTIVWQASIYQSRIPWFCASQEIGSVVVEAERFWKSIGKWLIRELLEHYGVWVESIISATVNPRMYSLFERNGFSQIPFPPIYLEEWRQYLAPKMIGGEKEFFQRARCYYRTT